MNPSNEKKYKVIMQGFVGKRKLYGHDSALQNIILDPEKDWYESIFFYDAEQKKHIEEHGPAGITKVVTNKLVWDLDSKENVALAKEDTQKLCVRLMEYGIDKDSIDVAFSGKKGFSVVVHSNSLFNPEEARNINTALAGDLATNDTKIAGDPQRLFRIQGTKHHESGLYKIPLTFEELNDLPIEDIKDLAKEPRGQVKPTLVDLPPNIELFRQYKEKTKAEPKFVIDVKDIDFKNKPKGFSNCKFALLNGFIPEGNRDNAFIALAATLKQSGFPKLAAYKMLKGVSELEAERSGRDAFKKTEIFTKVEQVYKDTWHGGTFSCKTEPWLKAICDSLGHNKCTHKEETLIVSSEEVFDLFSKYAENYEHNILTTGIKPLDDEVKFLVGTSNGILAPPGVGKTSMSLVMLNHNSKHNINSIFFSYDMYHSMVYIRLIQKHFGLSQERIFDIFKHDKKQVDKWKEVLKEEYKRVKFCFKSGQSADEIEHTILETEEKIGEKVKLIVVDYNELVIAKSTDPTQASAEIAQRFRQIANDREVCVTTLLQPAKRYADPADEASTYQAAKGSAAIAQSMTLMLGLNRPGYGRGKEDRYFSISALKNRNGPPFSVDLTWEGLRGEFGPMSDDDRYQIEVVRKARDEAKNKRTGNEFDV